ncbi:fatty acid desaturase family protein [Pseudomonadales bacterium]|jgi:fatty acid desaturase|nr:fatty acid desaturase family protein [Gammaproteobacteria bacterium]MDC0893528.1 fatty acid desaturase family protein [Pseudomonadales bacterium]MDC6449570.1 fatty acid desaturase family protein [Pseudomonadales bacterium]
MNIKTLLTVQEFASITRKDDFLAARMVATDWLLIGGAFFVAGAYPNPLTIILAIILIGSRQLGLGVIVHEAGHRTLFRSSKLNDFAGNWLAGYWVFSEKTTYMRGHLSHHKHAGTEQDPDLVNYRAYPIDKQALKRKVIRDLTGQIGWRRLKSIGRLIRKVALHKRAVRQYVLRSLGVNLLLFSFLALSGHAWLYAIWVIAFMTTHMLVVRIRQIAEHAAVPDLLDLDPRKNTRTLYVNSLENLLIAPHGVNYHLEHHLLASVPIYRLPAFHDMLLSKGFYDEVSFQRGYFDLLRSVTSNTGQTMGAG